MDRDCIGYIGLTLENAEFENIKIGVSRLSIVIYSLFC